MDLKALMKSAARSFNENLKLELTGKLPGRIDAAFCGSLRRRPCRLDVPGRRHEDTLGEAL